MDEDEANENSIYGGPTKRFFVSMLTRDIDLDDAILDLIDNSVDGAIRQTHAKPFSPSPFSGFEANLTLTENSFELTDNCGGIPDEFLADAFSLGRPSIDKDGDIPTIGMYGIGMKRAVFKIAKCAEITSINPEVSASVNYSREWLSPDNMSWDLDLEPVDPMGRENGVTIESDDLREEVAEMFANDDFCNQLIDKIATHYGYIMQRGFVIKLNGAEIEPVTLPLLSAGHGSQPAIRPFDFVSKFGDVHINVSIGFFRSLVRETEIDEESEAPSTAENAGISVVCNDRVVLIHDRTIKTGWGDGGVPRFHPQFRAIAGLVVLQSNKADQLPISTTKRDLDVGSDLFLQVRQACIEGLKIFTDFTNKWKGMEKETDEFFKNAEKQDVRTKIRLAADHGTAVRGNPEAKRYRPTLPMPVSKSPRRRISFVRDLDQIEVVSEHLFGERGEKPAMVGAECFDRAFKEAKK
ncbi:ATP-binding protein [Pontixanthobacter aquaemixtae]|uniref:ATP-binding protein n=1 Tax=Pontixanthobacter aquaemixtae TaxID=1958940 RepID=A0A844ZRK1_9SPHN|nr:ATP-binding protein [Pontixanthobacter aquaemixtae]MXO90473.1 ATP-binding protein [Pontixanthobacter aquaemixtae]